MGWTPLHYAAIHAPPTLVSFLATHGASSFAKSTKGLTPLDIITGFDVIPGREDVALVLQELMKASGWTGSARNQIREMKQREEAARAARRTQRRNEWAEVGRILGLADQWWEGRRPGEVHTPRIYLSAHDAEVAYQEEEDDATGVENFDDLDEDEDDPTGDIIDALLVSAVTYHRTLTYVVLVATIFWIRHSNLQSYQPPTNILCYYRPSQTGGLSITSTGNASQRIVRASAVCCGEHK